MAFTGAQLIVKVATEGANEVKVTLEQVGQEVQKTDEKAKSAGLGLSGMFKNALSFAAGGLIQKGISDLKDQIASVFEVTMAHQDVLAQLNQVLKSTHDVSGMTAGALNDLADSFSKTTRFSADTVLGGENLLLTFTNIGKSVFPQATQAILDVSQAMGQDLKSSAIQVGKALGDPLTGMTALQRIGVTFSATEKEQIKTMMAHNNIIGAQKIILHELSTEFGGSATAAGKTFAGQMAIVKNQMEDLKIKIGTALLPILTQFLSFVNTSIVPGLERFGGWFVKNAIPALQQFGGVVKTNVIAVFERLYPLLQRVGDFFGLVAHTVSLAVDAFHQVFNPIKQVQVAMQPLADSFDRATGFIRSTTQAAKPMLDAFDRARGIIASTTQVTKPMLDSFDRATSVIPKVHQATNPLVPLFQGIAKAIEITATVFHAIGSAVQASIPFFQGVWKVIVQIGGFLKDTFAPVWQNLVHVWQEQLLPSFKQLWSALQPLMPLFGAIAALIAGILIGALTGLVKLIAVVISDLASLLGGLVQAFTGIVQIVGGFLRIIWDLLTGNFDDMGAALKQIWEGIKNTLGGLLQSIGSIFHAVFGGIWAFISGFVQGIAGFFKWLSDILVGHSIIPDMINAIVSWFLQLPGRALSAVGGLIGQLANFFSGLANQAITWGGNIIRNLAGGIIGNIASAIGNAMSAVGTFISSHLPSSPAKRGPLRNLEFQGTQISEQIASGMKKNTPALSTALHMALSPIVSASLSPSVGLAGRQASAPVVVQPPDIYLDGVRLSRGLMPYVSNAIRYGVGGFGQ